MQEEVEIAPANDGNDTQSRLWVQRARDIFTTSSNYFDLNVRNRIIEDIRQFQSEHPTNSKYFTSSFKLRSKLFRPKTRAAIRKGEATAAAAFFSSEDVVAVRPIDDNSDEHVAAANIHKNLLQYRLTKPQPHGIPWFLTCCGAYQEAQSIGVVASFQQWKHNPLKKIDRPDITLLPVENYRFDSAADWRDPVNTSPYFVVLWPMYVKDIKARMKEGKWQEASDGTILSAARSTFDTIRQQREKGTDSKDQPQAISDYTIVWVHENFEEIEGIGDVVYFTLGTEHLLAKPVLVEERYPQGRPVVVGFAIVEAHKNYPSSVCSLTKDVQEEVNEVANSRLDNVKLILNKRYIVKRGGQVDLQSLVRNSPSSVTLANDPNGDVRVVTTDDATASSYQEQDRLNLDFDDLAGAFSGASVASNRKLNETVGGMNIISSNANQVSEYQLRTFVETWVEPVLRQLVILEQYYEDNATILELCGRQADIAKQGFKEVSIDLLEKDVLLNVNVGTGAVNPQTQVERFIFGLTSLQKIFPQKIAEANHEEIIKELFGKLGYKDGMRFWKKEDQQEDPRIAQLMQEIQQLKMALAQKNPPELVAAQVAKTNAETERILTEKVLKEIEAVNKRVEALFSSMQTAQTAVTVPGVAPVADAIAKSAGFVDQDGDQTVYPAVHAQQVPEMIPENTSPLHPANAARGMMGGFEATV